MRSIPLLVVLAFGAGCTSPPPPEVDVTGLWMGTVETGANEAPIYFTADAHQQGADLEIRLSVVSTGSLAPLGVEGAMPGLSVAATVAGRRVSFSRTVRGDNGLGIAAEVDSDDIVGTAANGSYQIHGVGGFSFRGSGSWSGNRVLERPLTLSLVATVAGPVSSLAFDGTDYWAVIYNGYSKLCRVGADGELRDCVLDTRASSDETACGRVVATGGSLWCFGGGLARRLSATGQVEESIPVASELASDVLAFDGQQVWAAPEHSGSQVCQYDASFLQQRCVATPFASIVDLALDGDDLWVLDDWPERLYVIDGSGAVQSTTELPAELLDALRSPGAQAGSSGVPGPPPDSTLLAALTAAGDTLTVATNVFHSSDGTISSTLYALQLR
jgi:hypothetical protein